MDDLMQTLFQYIIENRMEHFYEQTDLIARQENESALYQAFISQLTKEQRPLFQGLESAGSRTHTAELEAMFLATIEFCRELSQRF